MTTTHDSGHSDCRGIAICIATRDRPDGLRRLLDSLDRLDCPPVPVRIIVVDNSSVGFPDYASAACSARFEVTVLRETRIGIPFARNAALDVVHDDVWAAFIDDDEAASTGWLREIYGVMQRYRCDAVGGPVHTVFPDGLRHWTIDWGAFHRHEFATGTLCDCAATNNALVRVSTVRRNRLRFDERFPLLGDDDSWFFRSLVRHARHDSLGGRGIRLRIRTRFASNRVMAAPTCFRWRIWPDCPASARQSNRGNAPMRDHASDPPDRRWIAPVCTRRRARQGRTPTGSPAVLHCSRHCLGRLDRLFPTGSSTERSSRSPAIRWHARRPHALD